MVICETKRLVLKTFDTGDAAFIYVLLNTPSWLQFIGDRNIRSLEDAKNYLENGPLESYKKNGFGLWKVELKGSHIPIGMCGLIKREGLEFADIGFALLPEYAGNGYAYEVASATMHYAKGELNIPDIVAITSEDNLHSIRLLNKLGLFYNRPVRLESEEHDLMLFTEKEHDV